MPTLNRAPPTNQRYYAESSNARALTISNLAHPLRISTVGTQ
jgi:hypothetical protein